MLNKIIHYSLHNRLVATPIEVEMRKYEADVNTTLVDTADREGRTIDVG